MILYCQGKSLNKGKRLDGERKSRKELMDRFEISTLRSYYGALLTPRQNEMLRLHFDEDISYGELSELFGISRQAVLDSVKRGGDALQEYESKLGIAAKESRIADALGGALERAKEGNAPAAAENIKLALGVLEE